MEKSTEYKGFNISVSKDISPWHEVECYYSVYNSDDGMTLTSGYFDTEESIDDRIAYLKDIIDNHLYNLF